MSDTREALQALSDAVTKFMATEASYGIMPETLESVRQNRQARLEMSKATNAAQAILRAGKAEGE